MIQEWFKDAKLGIFIHWGIYSKGVTSESWDMFNGLVSSEEYMAQANSFSAEHYDPAAWAEMFASAGAKYTVLTSKHHDGFALWDTALSLNNAKDSSPAGRDLIGPYAAQMRAKGLKVGLYFSHSDWIHPDYATVSPKASQIPAHLAMRTNPLAYPQGAEDPVAWERYLQLHRGQLQELCTRYQPDLLWFDGDWERDSEQWRFSELSKQLQAWSPGVVLNGRMGEHGDYSTPEQAIPIARPSGPWEFCMTINDSWGFRASDRNFKTARQCIRTLAECAGMGGNLLLDVGPTSDGRILPEMQSVLQGLGRWTKKHAEALYGTEAGLPPGHFYGASTLNKARDVLYLICFDKPQGQIAVKGLRNPVRRATVLGGAELSYQSLGGAPWANLPGVLWIDVPDEAADQDATVIKIELEGELDLYHGQGEKLVFNQ